MPVCLFCMPVPCLYVCTLWIFCYSIFITTFASASVILISSDILNSLQKGAYCEDNFRAVRGTYLQHEDYPTESNEKRDLLSVSHGEISKFSMCASPMSHDIASTDLEKDDFIDAFLTIVKNTNKNIQLYVFLKNWVKKQIMWYWKVLM